MCLYGKVNPQGSANDPSFRYTNSWLSWTRIWLKVGICKKLSWRKGPRDGPRWTQTRTRTQLRAQIRHLNGSDTDEVVTPDTELVWLCKNGLRPGHKLAMWRWYKKMTWTKLSDPVSEYFNVLKLPSHVFSGPLIYALPLKLNLYFNLIEFEIDFHTSAPPKFRIFERSKSPPSQNFNFIKFSNFFSLSKNKLNFNTQPFYNGLFGGKTIVVQFKVLKSTLWP